VRPGLARRREAEPTDGEHRTLTLWLDCLSPFYGWDRDTERQLRGDAVVPRIQFDPNNPLAVEWPAPRPRPQAAK